MPRGRAPRCSAVRAVRLAALALVLLASCADPQPDARAACMGLVDAMAATCGRCGLSEVYCRGQLAPVCDPVAEVIDELGVRQCVEEINAGGCDVLRVAPASCSRVFLAWWPWP